MPMTRRTTVILAGVLVGLLIFGVGVSLLTAPKGGKSIGTVDEAVKQGVIDQSVAADLRTGGNVTALVHLNSDVVYAQLSNLLGRDQVQALIARMRQLYAANKDLILARVGAGAERIRDFEHIGLIEVRFTTEQALLAVAQSPLVQRVGEIGSFALPNEDATGQPGNWPVAPSTYQGAGVAVGVLDTGVDVGHGDGITDHKYFEGDPIVMSVDKAPDDLSADDGGHGSHVSSIVHAVAPAAKIYVADVFSRTSENGPELDANGNPTGKLANLAAWPDVAAGVEWLIGLRESGVPIRAVNLSVGFGHFTEPCEDQVQFGDLVKAGIIPIVASGNDAFRKDGKKVADFQPGIGTPACVTGAVAVGNVTNGWNYVDGSCAKQAGLPDQVYPSSQSSPINASANVAIFAPGFCILGAYGYKSGTSMAAPHVTGAVADLASARNDASAISITAAITGSGPLLTDPKSGIVRHRLDVQAAIESLLAGSVPVATSPSNGRTLPSGDTLPGGGGTIPGSGSAGSGGGSFPVIPVIVIIGAAIAGYWWYRRRKSPAG